MTSPSTAHLTPLALAGALLAGCSMIGPAHVGSGVKIEESRELAPFHALHVSGSTRVSVSAGPEHRVDIRFDDNLMPFVRTEVVDGALEIELDDGEHGRFRFSGALELDVVTPELDALSIAGSSQLVATGIDAEDFEVSLAGSGKVTLAGRTGGLKLSVAGSGELLLAELTADRVELDIAGSGDITVHARESLDISIAGSGTVRYAGDPIISKSVMGSGRVAALP